MFIISSSAHGVRLRFIALLGIVTIAATGGFADPPAPPLTEPAAPSVAPAGPPYAGKSPAGELLLKWWAEGTAAGNIGDIYDNRDRTHSELDRKPFPQLTKHVYPKEQLDRRADWAAQHTLLPGVVFGNSSTSAPITMGGSNVRMYYSHPRGLPFLFTQYTHNNMYMYPEHQDHDPGHNGVGPNGQSGYGDVYPTNTPYLITSQGSSGSDQPFMKALPMTLAAFQPEVKKALVKTGLLMPTVQMILRSTAKQLKSPEDYLTGIAHPTVFEGANVDVLKMVQMAHEITLKTLPPIALIKVVEEDTFTNGVDYFEPAGVTEVLADTPAVIARVWRATAQKRRIVLSAETSVDANKRPLKYQWAVLRGDEKLITIKPLNEVGSRVEITLSYHARRPIAPGSALESNRVDIGAFVNNGAYWSPPAFVTFFGLDSEARAYDDKGRISEVGYGVGEPRITVKDWRGLLDGLITEPPRPALMPMVRKLEKEELAALKPIAESYRAKLVTKDDKAMKQLLEEKQPGLSLPVKVMIEGTLTDLARDMMFAQYDENASEMARATLNDATAGAAYKAARARLVQLGLVHDSDKEWRPDTGAVASRWGTNQVQRYNADLLAQVLMRGLIATDERPNYVDPNIARPKGWRDVYRYGSDGKLAGWKRFGLDKVYNFQADGRVILEAGSDGQPAKTAAVKYDQPLPKPGQQGPNWAPMAMSVEEVK